MTVKTRTGTLHAAEQALAKIQQQQQAKQVEVIQLGHALAGLDKDPESAWTGLLVSEREANKRNWTKERAQAQQELQGLARDVESATATLQQMRRRVKELPTLIARLRHDLTKEGRFGIELYKAEQAVIIVQNQVKSYELSLWRMEDELKALTGE